MARWADQRLFWVIDRDEDLSVKVSCGNDTCYTDIGVLGGPKLRNSFVLLLYFAIIISDINFLGKPGKGRTLETHPVTNLLQ